VTRRGAAALGLVVAGALLDVEIAIVLGLLAFAVELVHDLWSRRGLAGVSYVRRLARERIPWGEEIPMTIEVWNRKPLPLAWLRADDAVSDGVVVRGRPIVETEQTGLALRNTWTLAPFERVVRRVRVAADRRGVFSIGPAGLRVGDLLARQAAASELPGVDRFIVWPRTVPSVGLARPDRWGDVDRARRGLLEDPARFAGVRPYSPGDPLRRIHARASARLGVPVTKRFEPSRERQVLIALDIQTGRRWRRDGSPDEDPVETLIVVAASLVRSLDAERTSFGLTAAGYSGQPSRFADVPVAGTGAQADRVLDVLARLSSEPSAPFDLLLGRIRHRLRPGATVFVITGRSPASYLAELRRLRRAGFDVAVLACGPDAHADATLARSAGFTARAAALDGPWRSATRLAATG